MNTAIHWDAFSTIRQSSIDFKHTIFSAYNLAQRKWYQTKLIRRMPDPLTNEEFLFVPDTQPDEFKLFQQELRLCPLYGLHNPYYNVERYRILGAVCARAAAALREQTITHAFAKLIQHVIPKAYDQCLGEVEVTKQFLETFSGDNVRFLAQGFMIPGDRDGQQPHEYPWPYGPVIIIAPFNFPLEIPGVQTLAALFMGNKPLVKVDSKVSIVFEQFLRLLHFCGLPKEDVGLIHCRGEVMEEFIRKTEPHIELVQFTGSSAVGNLLTNLMKCRVLKEDSGFNWKILGPDFQQKFLPYVAWQSDKDAYDASGQKCSAQSLLVVHENWWNELIPLLQKHAEKRTLEDLTVGPFLTLSTETVLHHVKDLLTIPGASLLFGGKSLTPLEDWNVPKEYGLVAPTAVFVPLESCLQHKNHPILLKEVFAPVQIVTSYNNRQLDYIIHLFEQMPHHLTASIVSDDQQFITHMIGHTVSGVTYIGMRARTTGAPTYHHFGPRDVCAADIGTPEGIRKTWSYPRGIIMDRGPVPSSWRSPLF